MNIPQESTSDDRPTGTKQAVAGAEVSQPVVEAAIGGPAATAEASIDASRADRAYEGTPPWDIPGPQPAFVGLAEEGWITGKTLDVGCGTGENALFLAQRGLEVMGVDASVRAIEKARVKAEQRAVSVRFLVADALDLAALHESFDTVIDSGLLHSFSDKDRSRLVSGVHTVLRPGGCYLLLCFSEHATLPGPRRLAQDDIRASFGEGWAIESIVPSRFELTGGEPGAPMGTPTEQSAGLAWLARIRRA
jgi:SAM-dependent methyltransferase